MSLVFISTQHLSVTSTKHCIYQIYPVLLISCINHYVHDSLLKICFKKKKNKQTEIKPCWALAFNPSTQEAEADGSLSSAWSRTARSTPRNPVLKNKTTKQTTKQNPMAIHLYMYKLKQCTHIVRL